MPILRNREKHYFAALDAEVIRSAGLSLPARGLLITLLNHSDDWKVRLRATQKETDTPMSALLPLFDELKQKGFLVSASDTYGEYFDVHEKPLPAQKAEPIGKQPKETPKKEPKEEPQRLSDERIEYWRNYFAEKFPRKGQNKAT